MSNWEKICQIASEAFICGYCGEKVASATGYFGGTGNYIYICPHCDGPNIFLSHRRYPDSALGNKVQNVPGDIEKLYNEARQSTRVQAFTASVMASRKM